MHLKLSLPLNLVLSAALGVGAASPSNGAAQEFFEKNSAGNIFGDSAPQVEIYKGPNAAGQKNLGQSGITPNPRARRLESLEQDCDRDGPKSRSCTELRVLRSMDYPNAPQRAEPGSDEQKPIEFGLAPRQKPAPRAAPEEDENDGSEAVSF